MRQKNVFEARDKNEKHLSNATQKAHAIFYVAKKPTPPQKGGEGKEGTIEKIQKQLGLQTEVYTIYNKAVTNPRALKDGLIDESERESLKILNKEMEKILGGTLQGASNSQRPNGFLWPCIGFNPREWFLQKQTKISRSF
ncbi:hypothetical protein HpMS172_10480 [Helicobacter pylori]